MAYKDIILAAGPSNYWTLNESSGLTAADAAGSAPGTISGGVTLAQPGALADGTTAMTFDGVDDQIVTSAAVALPLAVSLEVWAKLGATSAYHCWLSNRGASAVLPILCGVIDRELLCYCEGATPVQVTSVTLLTAGVWTHVVLTHDGATARWYVNGTLFASAAQVRSGTPVGAVVGLGREAGGLFPYPGSLDEVAIYPRALTPTEISDHYAARLTVSVPSAGCDHTTVWSKHLSPLSAPTVESERAYLSSLYGEPGGTDFSTLVSRWLQAIDCGAVATTPAAPTLSTVAPNTGTQGTMVTVTLTGTGFIANSTGVSVNGVGISVVNIQVTSPTTLTADLAIAADAPPTARTLTVTTAGGSSTQAFTVAGVVQDPNFAAVVLLVGAETALVDESHYARPLTTSALIARSTAQAKYGTASVLYHGSVDSLLAADSAEFALGAAPFTAEGWFWFVGKTDSQALLGQWDQVTANCSWFLYITGAKLTFRISTGAAFKEVSVAFVPTLGQWYHLAVDRSGSTVRLYVNGAVVITDAAFTDTLINSTNPFTVGSIYGPFAAYDFNGYMDEIRVTVGVARYAGAFTPPTAAFPRS